MQVPDCTECRRDIVSMCLDWASLDKKVKGSYKLSAMNFAKYSSMHSLHQPSFVPACSSILCQETQATCVFPVPGGIAVLDPETVQAVNAINYADTILPDRLVDPLRRRTIEAIDQFM